MVEPTTNYFVIFNYKAILSLFLFPKIVKNFNNKKLLENGQKWPKDLQFFFTRVPPINNYFVFFYPGSGQQKNYFVIFYCCSKHIELLTLKLLRDRSKFKIKFSYPFFFKTVEFLADVFECNSVALDQRKYTLPLHTEKK